MHLRACAQTPKKTCCCQAKPWCLLEGCDEPPVSTVVRRASGWALVAVFVPSAPCKDLLGHVAQLISWPGLVAGNRCLHTGQVTACV